MSELSPYLVLLLVGFLPNEIWACARRLDRRRSCEDPRLIVLGAKRCGRGAGRG